MKKIISMAAATVLFAVLFLAGVPGVSAQTVTPTLAPTLTDTEAEIKGEQLMEQMMGGKERHEQMDQNIIRNMGEEFLRQMHISMGRQGTTDAILSSGMARS